MKSLLLHICCAPCALGALDVLKEEGFDVTGFFYNPNIHPLIEFRRRLKAMKMLMEAGDVKAETDDEYGLEAFLQEVYMRGGSGEGRCARCYEMRLRRAARRTRELGLPAFTTTLLASQHQDVELVAQVGESAANAEGVEFVRRDFRENAERGREDARRRSLYTQSYCGCIFSENERYRDTSKHLYRGPGGRN